MDKSVDETGPTGPDGDANRADMVGGQRNLAQLEPVTLVMRHLHLSGPFQHESDAAHPSGGAGISTHLSTRLSSGSVVYPEIKSGTGFSNDAPRFNPTSAPPRESSQYLTSATSSAAATARTPSQVQVPSDAGNYDTNRVVEAGWNQMQKKGAVGGEREQHLRLVGDRQVLDELAAEYHASNHVMIAKLRSLGERYHGLRRSRGDGNCFYRSFLFGYLEGLIEAKNVAEAKRMCSVLLAWKSRLQDTDCPADHYEQGAKWIVVTLAAVFFHYDYDSLMQRLVDDMRSWEVSMQAIQFVRFIAACEIRARSDHFAPFVMGLMDDMDVESFCRRHVVMMGEESDHIQLVALVDALMVPVRVAYLDNRAAPGLAVESLDACVHDFHPQGWSDGCAAQVVHILYRPGHYDVLYPKT